jgi:quinol monooxygenase YgiN
LASHLKGFGTSEGAMLRLRFRTFNHPQGELPMSKPALYVRLEAKPGKENEVADFLQQALPLVQQEQGTTAWFALRISPTTFGIFDTFEDESGRQAHLSGQVAAALKQKASDLFAQPPNIEKVDVLAAKLPGSNDTVRAA